MKTIFQNIACVALFVFSLGLINAQEYRLTVHLTPDDGLKQMSVTKLAEDTLGRIWIGTADGLQFYTGFEIKTITQINERVTGLHIRHGFVYCSTIKAIYRINPTSLQISSFQFQKNNFYLVDFNKDDIAVFENNFDHFIDLDYKLKELPERKGNHKSKYYLPKKIYCGDVPIYSDTKGGYYIMDSDTIFFSKSYNHECCAYSEDRAFLFSNEGLYQIQNTDGQVKVDLYFPNVRMESYLIDRNKNLWIGTSEHGLYMIHRNTLASRCFPLTTATNEPLPCWGIFCLDNQLYVATSQGIICLDNKADELDKYEKLVGNFSCFCGVSEGGTTLIGGSSQGVYRLEESGLKSVYFNPNDGLDNLVVQLIATDEGFLACTKRSFILLDKKGGFVQRIPYTEKSIPGYVMQIIPQDSGYVAGLTNGAVRLDNHLNIIEKKTNSRAHVVSTLVDYKGDFYGASMDGGLVLWGKDSLEIVPFEDKKLISILNDNQGNLWVNSFRHLYRYNSQNVRPYSAENGFEVVEYSQSCFYQTPDKLYFGGLGGITEFSPEDVAELPDLPQVVLHHNGVFIPQDSLLSLNYDQSELILDITPIVLSDSNLFVMEYKLDGEWKKFRQPKKVIFHTEFGNRELLIQVTNKVNQSSRRYSYKIHRDSPFWTSWWFRLLVFILLGLLAFGIYNFVQYLKTKKLLQKEQAEKKITEERLRISKELHDNIGARLTHIISSLDIEMYQRKDNITSIENINAFARETMSQLRETIWAVSDKTIFFSEFATRVKQYVEQVNKMTKIEVNFGQENIADFELNPVQTINYYRIIQEAINNAIKYSEATQVEVKIENEDNQPKITISDNGIGFDDQSKRTGTGLNGMEIRANEAGGKVKITSKIGKGTLIEVLLLRN